jgi:hypothetical protein
MKSVSVVVASVSAGFVVCAIAGCSAKDGVGSPSSSEVATSIVSGGINNTSGSSMAWNAPVPKRTPWQRAADALDPIGTAWAATWTCSGGSLTPAFAGPASNPYEYTPVSCSVVWGNDRTASSRWSGAFTLDYGSDCDSTHAFIGNQVASCTVTRSTPAGGNTRTITGPNGDSYAILHDTNGAGTGWDTSVAPPPTNGGVIATPTSLVISGSHLSGTVDVNGRTTKIWDHTVSTGAGGLTVAGSGTSRVVNGSLTVQHNLLKYTATCSFENVGYGDGDCCFPTTGTVSTTFSNGPNTGKTETLAFSRVCGEATLTTASGESEALTLQHCL